MKREREKELLIEQLKKTPIVQVACEKMGIGRATYYRWRKEDGEFTKKTDDAIHEGSLLINDMAESQLISSIKDKNITAIIYWLRHHHPIYTNRLEILNKHTDDGALSSEQKELILNALHIAQAEEPAVTLSKYEEEKP